MFGYSTVFGIDSHARTTTVCALVVETGETETRTFPGNPHADIAAWMGRFPQPSLGVYESGCTGFVPARLLSGGGVTAAPVAAGAVRPSVESRSKKNDRRGAARLARLAAAGGLREVWVPSEEVEGLRDLAHAAEDAASARESARMRVEGPLCRHGVVWDERAPSGKLRRRWGVAHWAWLDRVELPDPGSQAALALALRAARQAEALCEEVDRKAREAAAASSLAPVAEALQCVRGCGFATAPAFAAEVGDFGRFQSGRRATPCFGLAPSERSSAGRRSLGPVSKAGCRMVRRLLVEGAWQHARPLRSKAKPRPGVPDAVRLHAEKGSRRMADRRSAMLDRGLCACKANAASAAEAAHWLWAVGLMAHRCAVAEAARAA